MNNWIEDGHGNKWHRCKLGPDCGLKVIEAGRAKCWCQDQEASRCEVQSAREQIRCLEADNERLREEAQRAKVDRDLAGWDDYAVIVELKSENAALKAKVEVIVANYEDYKAENAALRVALEDIMTESDEQVIWRMARAALERKEAQP